MSHRSLRIALVCSIPKPWKNEWQLPDKVSYSFKTRCVLPTYPMSSKDEEFGCDALIAGEVALEMQRRVEQNPNFWRDMVLGALRKLKEHDLRKLEEPEKK